VILSTIQSIAEPYRVVFNMFVFENMKHKEIAELLQIDENTSRTRLVRAKKHIQKKLEALVTSSKNNHDGC
jgi:RNA polymerase sigma-70 factor (ECF subfamily)